MAYALELEGNFFGCSVWLKLSFGIDLDNGQPKDYFFTTPKREFIF